LEQSVGPSLHQKRVTTSPHMARRQSSGVRLCWWRGWNRREATCARFLECE